MIWLFYAVAVLVAEPAEERVAGLDKASIRATKAMMNFGECVARSRATDVGKLLDTKFGSDAELKALLWVARTDMDCDLSGFGQIKISRELLMGAILEAYYHQNLSKNQMKLNPLQTDGPFLPAKSDQPDLVRRGIVLTNFGTCLSNRNPAAVGALLKTTPMTRGEAAATNNLQPTFRACSAAKGASLATQELRAVAATGLVNRLTGRFELAQSDSSGAI